MSIAACMKPSSPSPLPALSCCPSARAGRALKCKAAGPSLDPAARGSSPPNPDRGMPGRAMLPVFRLPGASVRSSAPVSGRRSHRPRRTASPPRHRARPAPAASAGGFEQEQRRRAAGAGVDRGRRPHCRSSDLWVAGPLLPAARRCPALAWTDSGRAASCSSSDSADESNSRSRERSSASGAPAVPRRGLPQAGQHLHRVVDIDPGSEPPPPACRPPLRT